MDKMVRYFSHPSLRDGDQSQSGKKITLPLLRHIGCSRLSLCPSPRSGLALRNRTQEKTLVSLDRQEKLSAVENNETIRELWRRLRAAEAKWHVLNGGNQELPLHPEPRVD